MLRITLCRNLPIKFIVLQIHDMVHVPLLTYLFQTQMSSFSKGFVTFNVKIKHLCYHHRRSYHIMHFFMLCIMVHGKLFQARHQPQSSFFFFFCPRS